MAPGGEPAGRGKSPAGRGGRGGKSPGRRGRTGAVAGERTEIRRPIVGSYPCPTSRHEAREFPRPFSCDAALDPRPSCSGRFLQGRDQRRQGPMPLDPAKLALGTLEARRAPPSPHLPVTPPRHAGRDPPRYREGRLDRIGRRQRPPHAPGPPSRTTVSVSTNPSRRLEAASGLIRSSQRVVASSDALAAS